MYLFKIFIPKFFFSVFGLDDVAIGAGIAGIGNVIGSIFSNKSNEKINAKNLQHQALEGYKARYWAAKMSNTAHQREVADLEKAGLNPMLSVMGGSGAASPGPQGAPSGSSLRVDNVIGPGVSSAVQAALAKKDLEVRDSSVDLNNALTEQAVAKKRETDNNAKVADLSAKKLEAEMPAIKAASEFNRATSEFDRKAVQFDGYLKRVGAGIGAVNNALQLANPLKTIRGMMSGQPPTGEELKKAGRKGVRVDRKGNKLP